MTVGIIATFLTFCALCAGTVIASLQTRTDEEQAFLLEEEAAHWRNQK